MALRHPAGWPRTPEAGPDLRADPDCLTAAALVSPGSSVTSGGPSVTCGVFFLIRLLCGEGVAGSGFIPAQGEVGVLL